MERRLKNRLVGAVVLVALAVVFLPEWLRPVAQPRAPAVNLTLPPPPAHTYQPKSPAFQPSAEQANTSEPPAQIPEQAAPPPSLRGWVVQVGSFSSQANAYRLRDQLRQGGYAAFVEAVTVNDRTLHRVRVGPELSKSAADNQRQAIAGAYRIEGQLMEYP